jgi:hypothetical protein
MFNFFEMMGNYEQRKVANFEKGDLVVDTAAVTDADKPYETGIQHPAYNAGEWVIVELYDTKEEAQKGRNRWVKKMTGKKMPKELRDVSTAGTAKLIDAVRGDMSWRKKLSKS